MLQRTPRSVAKRRQQQRWRERVKSGVPYVGGDPPPALIDTLIDYQWLAPEQATNPRAIFAAMVAALATLPKRKM